jgi:hypothetical protein
MGFYIATGRQAQTQPEGQTEAHQRDEMTTWERRYSTVRCRARRWLAPQHNLFHLFGGLIFLFYKENLRSNQRTKSRNLAFDAGSGMVRASFYDRDSRSRLNDGNVSHGDINSG